jgi:hypothetical protein
MRWAGHAARMGETKNAYRILVGKSEWKRPLERPHRKYRLPRFLSIVAFVYVAGITWLICRGKVFIQLLLRSGRLFILL